MQTSSVIYPYCLIDKNLSKQSWVETSFVILHYINSRVIYSSSLPKCLISADQASLYVVNYAVLRTLNALLLSNGVSKPRTLHQGSKFSTVLGNIYSNASSNLVRNSWTLDASNLPTLLSIKLHEVGLLDNTLD